MRVTPSSESLLAQATHVARVRVISRDPIELPYRSRSVSCGSYYRVQVIDALKGDAGGTLDFVAEETLDVAAEYLVAVSDTGSGRGSWDTERLRCRAAYERVATGIARVEAAEDGLVVEDSRLLPERIREQAVADEVPWLTVKRDLFAAAPQATHLPPQQEPATQETEPEATEPETPEQSPWLPWNWEFEWL